MAQLMFKVKSTISKIFTLSMSLWRSAYQHVIYVDVKLSSTKQIDVDANITNK